MDPHIAPVNFKNTNSTVAHFVDSIVFFQKFAVIFRSRFGETSLVGGIGCQPCAIAATRDALPTRPRSSLTKSKEPYSTVAHFAASRRKLAGGAGGKEDTSAPSKP